jgi:hypothetical protein
MPWGCCRCCLHAHQLGTAGITGSHFALPSEASVARCLVSRCHASCTAALSVMHLGKCHHDVPTAWASPASRLPLYLACALQVWLLWSQGVKGLGMGFETGWPSVDKHYRVRTGNDKYSCKTDATADSPQQSCAQAHVCSAPVGHLQCHRPSARHSMCACGTCR